MSYISSFQQSATEITAEAQHVVFPSDSDHRYGTVSTDVLDILPAKPVSFKRKSTIAFTSAAVAIYRTRSLPSSFHFSHSQRKRSLGFPEALHILGLVPLPPTRSADLEQHVDLLPNQQKCFAKFPRCCEEFCKT